MQRITITLGERQLASLDEYISRRGYSSRSEAIRDILRAAETRELNATDPSSFCYATLSCVYEHETRELAKRLTEVQHHRHDLSVASLHVHVSSDECLEVAVLKGPLADLQDLADEVLTQRGVRMGHLHVIPAANSDNGGSGDAPGHAGQDHGHGHGHDHHHD